MSSRLNFNASPIGLYDIVAPSVPCYVDTRNAIEKHRNGERPPVAFPAGDSE